MKQSLAAAALLAATMLGCAADQEATPPVAGETSADVSPATRPSDKGAQKGVQKGVQLFGEQMKLTDAQAIPVEQLLANPDAYAGKFVRVTGDVNKVCTRKGCWLEMESEKAEKPLFVKFTCPIEGRLIPMEAVGKKAVVEGTVKVEEFSEADAKHLKEESGASPEEVEKIKGPQKKLTLASPACQISGL